MTPARFLELRRPAWERAEALIALTRRRGVSALSELELHELARLYPSIAVDVARARTCGFDSSLQRRINGLAFAAHGLLYRRDRVRGLPAVASFFAKDYPRLFRRLWAYMALSVAIFGVISLATYAAVRIRPAAAYQFVPHGLSVGDVRDVTAEDISKRFRQMPGSIMSSSITANNISVAFAAFAMGITVGLGTCYVLLMNGMMLGAFFGHFANHDLGYECASFLVPHGALEIFAILVAGAAGLRLGLSLAAPGALTRKASLRAGAVEALLLMLGTIPMFVVAGLTESFITPSELSNGFKLAWGVSLLAITLAYLLLAGRERPGASPLTAAGRP